MRVCFAGCTINISGGDLNDIQPLIIQPGLPVFIYPEDKAGIVYLADRQEIEIYCTSDFVVPPGAGNSRIAKCVDGNLFEVNGVHYSFKQFSCRSQAAHSARRSGKSCFNGASLIEIGFELGNRFAKVLEVCHSEVTEETHYAKFQLTPATQGFATQSFNKKLLLISFFFKATKGHFHDRLLSRAGSLMERTSMRFILELCSEKQSLG